MDWPQITLIVLMGGGLLLSAHYHGRPRGPHSFWTTLVADAITITLLLLITITLLLLGGFFGCAPDAPEVSTPEPTTTGAFQDTNRAVSTEQWTDTTGTVRRVWCLRANATESRPTLTCMARHELGAAAWKDTRATRLEDREMGRKIRSALTTCVSRKPVSSPARAHISAVAALVA